jgi:type IV pilus assembly protein PilQ
MTIKKVYMAVVTLLLIGLIVVIGGCATQSEPLSSQDQKQTEPTVRLDSITSSETRDATYVTIAGDGPLTFSSFKKPDPPSVVLIFPATSMGQVPSSPMLNSELIEQVKVSNGNGGSTARVEFQLAADVAYTASQQGAKVELTFNRPHAKVAETTIAASPIDTVPAPAAPETVSSSQPLPSSSPEKPVRSTVNVPKSTAWVNKIDFLSKAGGKSTLVLGTTHAVDYRVNKINPEKIEVQILNTRIPSYRQRALITTRFNSAVDRIVPYQADRDKNETRVSIELRESVPYYVEQTDNLLMVHFESSSVPPKPMEIAQLPAWKKSLVDDVQTVGGAAAPAFAAVEKDAQAPEDVYYEDVSIEEDAELKTLLAPRKKKYTGEKIALDFYNTDIKNVFRILREVSGKNFAIDKDVTGKVTMTLDKPVPWDQVLDLVLRMNQLGMSYEGEIIRIATLETLKTEDDLRKAKLEALRKSREEAKALEPLVTKYIAVSYANAEKEIQPHIEKILTDERGSLSVDLKNNQLIITDTEAKVAQATDIVRRIDKVTSQVVIEAKIVEVTKDFTQELGIDWSLSHGPGIAPGLDWNTTSDMAMNFPSPNATSSIGVQFSRLTGVPFVLNARLNALETTGNGRILSSPKILTLDNKKAKIKQGLEYPYLERDSTGGASIKFKEIDLLLEVTPHVTPDNRISMAIYLTKNDVDALVDGIPALATNEAQTELLVNDGDTVVIGGIVKRTENIKGTGFPLLSRIPILGWAFKNETKVNEDNELLIFMTPRIVQLEQELVQFSN